MKLIWPLLSRIAHSTRQNDAAGDFLASEAPATARTFPVAVGVNRALSSFRFRGRAFGGTHNMT
jgi:hypothetical protein